MTKDWKNVAGSLGPDEDPENGGPTLRKQAEWAGTAVETYGRLTGLEREPETAVKDLLIDIMHMCDRDGYDFDHLLEVARGFYELEINGEL